MMMTQSNNKRIVKNTLFLYIRMFLMMGISLYTSRIILATLGVTDYGIYNVVGGVVTMLGFLTGAMSSATQRFLLVKLGINDVEGLRTTFHSALLIHYSIYSIILSGNYWAVVLECANEYPRHKNGSSQLGLSSNGDIFCFFVIHCTI